MFRKRVFVIYAGILGLFAFFLLRLVHITPQDRSDYDELLSFFSRSDTKHHLSSDRTEVLKDLWIHRKDDLYHYSVFGENTSLHLDQRGKNGDTVTEDMQAVSCYLQQKKYYLDENGIEKTPDLFVEGKTYFPQQQICHIQAKNGHYDYLKKHFNGESVDLDVFQIPGHDLKFPCGILEGKLLLKGVADTIEFHFSENKPHIHTHNLTATIFADEKLP